jgi:tetratricopeptide (TPR) repeat protein
MDAQTLFREGVLALREGKDAPRARQLLTQSLRANPNNEMAWLWLARTYTDKEKQIQCIDRALRLNPANEQALAFKQRLMVEVQPEPQDYRQMLAVTGRPIEIYQEEPEPEAPSAPQTMQTPLSPAEQKQVAALLAKAKQLAAEDMEGAIEQWVYVLDIRADHPEAIQNAVRGLAKLQYMDDARTLLNNAIEAGTNQPSIYMTALDLARHQHDFGEAESLMEQVAKLPTTTDDVVVKMVAHFTEDQPLRAVELLQEVLKQRPDNAQLLIMMGDLMGETMGKKVEASRYYERASRLKGGKTKRMADKAMSSFVPVITDRERGSVGLALREALGFSALFLFMGWQDAGLNLLLMGPMRWLGVVLAFGGGYLVITATSSAQQKPLAAWLGGKVPPPAPPKPERRDSLYDDEILPPGPIQEPTELPIIPAVLRIAFGVVGLVILAGAFVLVFSTALQLLRNPVPPYIPSLRELFEGLEGF